jgi:HSP20 family molecular chaperone IbpA
MAFFPRSFYGTSDASFTPLFRLLDDFDSYSRQQNGQRGHRNHVPTFQPKFDVREVEDAYELHGELAGMDKKDVHIEFTDPHTLLVRGRIERSYTAGTPPAGLLEDNSKMSGALTDAPEEKPATPTKDTVHQATVEDEVDETASTTSTEQPTPATTVATVAEVAKPEKVAKPTDNGKYWVSERSIGEFSRSFHFPGLVQTDGVTANLRDGVLSVRVPKAKKHESRRIDIN